MLFNLRLPHDEKYFLPHRIENFRHREPGLSKRVKKVSSTKRSARSPLANPLRD